MANFATIVIKTQVQARGDARLDRPRKAPMLRRIEEMLDHDGGRKKPPISLVKLSCLQDSEKTSAPRVLTAGEIWRASLPVGTTDTRTNEFPRHYVSQKIAEREKTQDNKRLTREIIAFIESKKVPDPILAKDFIKMLPQSILRARQNPEQELVTLVGRAFAALGWRKGAYGRTKQPPGRRRKSVPLTSSPSNKQKVADIRLLRK